MYRDNYINAFLIGIVLILLNSCAGGGKFSDQKLLIEMKKTACYGECPVYTLQIDKRGNGTFNGIENIDPAGFHTFRLDRDELSLLVTAFEQIDFFYLKDRYYEPVSDLPTTYLSYRSGDRVKRVMDYYGAPKELKDLEDLIEKIVFSTEMRQVK